MIKKICLVFAISGAIGVAMASEAKQLGSDGAVYEISEPDALAEMEDRASRVDWSKVMSRERIKNAIDKYRPAGVKTLPRTANSKTRDVDLTYTLSFDIPDGNGGILYPKGFRFNPLDYMPSYRFVQVFIDGDDPDQVSWFKYKYGKDMMVKLFITGGQTFELYEKLGRPVFYAMPYMLEKLGLEAVPAVVQQKGKCIEVSEIDVAQEIKKIKKN